MAMAGWDAGQSLPSWERGLKYDQMASYFDFLGVAPLVGAWIEIVKVFIEVLHFLVAPLVGAWIEIYSTALKLLMNISRSPRGSVD